MRAALTALYQAAQHPLIALAMQVAVALAGFGWWAGAALGAGFFVGREIAQAEYRWIERYGHGRRANMPPFIVFRDARAWDRKSLTDFLFPAAAVFAVAFLSNLLTR